MSIEKFLSDFDEQNKKIKEAQLREQEEKEKQKADNEKYLVDFQEYYETEIIPELKQIQKKLKSKFNLNYQNEPKLSQGAYFYKTELTPNFENFTKKIEIEIIAEGERRLITLTGKAYGPKERDLNIEGLHRFQDTMKDFKKIDVENEITGILNKIFL